MKKLKSIDTEGIIKFLYKEQEFLFPFVSKSKGYGDTSDIFLNKFKNNYYWNRTKFKCYSKELDELIEYILFSLFDSSNSNSSRLSNLFQRCTNCADRSEEIRNSPILFLNGLKGGAKYFTKHLFSHATMQNFKHLNYIQTNDYKYTEFQTNTNIENLLRSLGGKLLILSCHGNKNSVTFEFQGKEEKFTGKQLLQLINFSCFNEVLLLFCDSKEIGEFLDSIVRKPIYLWRDGVWRFSDHLVYGSCYLKSVVKYSQTMSANISSIITALYKIEFDNKPGNYGESILFTFSKKNNMIQ